MRRWSLLVVVAALACPATARADIANGRPPTHPHPWAAYVRAEGETFICSGALIAPRWVLTAAHCVAALIYGGPPRPAQLFRITVGTHTPSDGTGDTHGATRVIVHPDYQLESGVPDIALIELDGAARTQPLSVAGPGYESAWAPGQVGLAIGWGTDRDNGPVADSLRETDLRVAPIDACRMTLAAALELCTNEVVAGSSPCSGDSGGPLVMPVPGGRFVLAGVLNRSSGEGCGQGEAHAYAAPGRPAVRGWIASYVPEAIAVPPPPPPPPPSPPMPGAPAVPAAAKPPARKPAKPARKKASKRKTTKRCKRRKRARPEGSRRCRRAVRRR